MGFSGLLRGLETDILGAQSGQQDQRELARRARLDLLQKRLMEAHIADSETQAKQRLIVKPKRPDVVWTDQGLRQYNEETGEWDLAPMTGQGGKNSSPPASAPHTTIPLGDGDTLDLGGPALPLGQPEPGQTPPPGGPRGIQPRPDAPRTPREPRLPRVPTQQEQSAAGQYGEAATAMRQMNEIEARNSPAANKAAGFAAAEASGIPGKWIAELRNPISGDPDAQAYFQANTAWRLAISGLRGQRGNQYLLDLERRATTRAVNEGPSARAIRLEAQQQILNELQKKAGLAGTDAAEPAGAAPPAAATRFRFKYTKP